MIMQNHSIILDPYLLCLPNPCIEYKQLEDFIFSITNWTSLFSSGKQNILISDSIREALNNDDEYPLRHKLHDLIVKFKCNFADANTITKILNSILTRSPSLEDFLGINDILYDEDSVSIIPIKILDRLKQNCKLAFLKDIIKIGIKISSSSSEEVELETIIASTSFEKLFLSDVEINADVYEVESINKLSVIFPYKLSQNIPIIFNYKQWESLLDINKIWKNTNSQDEIAHCIKVTADKISLPASKDESRKFLIGDGFIPSLRKWDSAGKFSNNIMKSCAHIILNQPKYELNIFRTSSNKHSNQIIRHDGAKAFRTHLSKNKLALRLMFWERIDGAIEFANIGSKNELKIF